MKTELISYYKELPEGRDAEEIIRSCVHCGFCTATCPTYQELNDERDGPRGRIYLIKQLLEGGEVTEKTRTHLDRCLTCRSCETTCPSGVEYGRLIDFGRAEVEKKTASTFETATDAVGFTSNTTVSPALFRSVKNRANNAADFAIGG